MTDIKTADQPKILNDLIGALAQASGGCSQMVHQRGGDPRWMMLRENIELVKEACIARATVHANMTTAVKPW